MNREQRRKFKKSLSKENIALADKIIQWHKLYDGVDDKKFENLMTEAIKELPYDELMKLMIYVESIIGDTNS